MRKRSSKNGISVHIIAGTEVVMMAFDASAAARKGLLGFSIYKKKGHGKEQALIGGKVFEGLEEQNKRKIYRSDLAPIQSFMWSDYSVAANTEYSYRVVPVYGKPDALKPGQALRIKVRTENPDDGKHGVFFNRGVAGSQAYSRRFGKYRKAYKVSKGFDKRETWQDFIKPEDVPDRQAYKWLSRGLEEAMLGFITQAQGNEYGLRGALYEFTHLPAIQAFVDALESGADVKIVHHAKTKNSYAVSSDQDAVTTVDYNDPNKQSVVFKKKELKKARIKDSVASDAQESLVQVGLRLPADHAARKALLDRYDKMFIERTKTTISHNKFVVLLKNGKPVEVWTGSTNFTGGGIYGQSNVGHIIRDEKIARAYLDYWDKLQTDPEKSKPVSNDDSAGMKYWTVQKQPDLVGAPPPNSITPIFSPRASNAMLQWYADLIATAKSSVHFTAAFTVSDQIFKKVTTNRKSISGKPFLRYLLLEGIGGLMRKTYPAMAKHKQNVIAWGETLKSRNGDDREIETLTGLNNHVNYLHTKYMLIDPLTDDPIVVSGSANFSDASTVNNDENMLIIRGNKRLADIFLGEFMRLFNHFKTRNRSNRLSDEEAERSSFLKPDNSWTDQYYKKGTQEYEERVLFK